MHRSPTWIPQSWFPDSWFQYDRQIVGWRGDAHSLPPKKRLETGDCAVGAWEKLWERSQESNSYLHRHSKGQLHLTLLPSVHSFREVFTAIGRGPMGRSSVTVRIVELLRYYCRWKYLNFLQVLREILLWTHQYYTDAFAVQKNQILGNLEPWQFGIEILILAGTHSC